MRIIMRYFRVHTADIAYITQQPRGIFTAIGKRIYAEMTFYREMAKKYEIQLYMSECEDVPGDIIYEDEFQIAIKNPSSDVRITTKEIE